VIFCVANAESVGISVAIFAPLIFIAFYVNRISAMLKSLMHNVPFRENMEKGWTRFVGEKEITTDEDELDDSDDEEDDEQVDKEKEDYLQYGTGPNRLYAPLFGKYQFHKSIPVIRTLWRYERDEEDEEDEEVKDVKEGDDDDYDGEPDDRDYPLRHFRYVTVRFFRVLTRTVFFFLPRRFLPMDEEDDYDYDIEPPEWARPLPFTIQDLEDRPVSPDAETLFNSEPGSPSSPYVVVEEHIRRTLSPTLEPPIASRGLGFSQSMSFASEAGGDYFAGIRGRASSSRLSYTDV